MKICTHCKILKEEREFNKHSKNKLGLASWCKICTRIASNKHYIENNEQIKKNQTKARKKHRKWYDDYKKTLSCSKCGFSHPAVLDFHHFDSDKKEHEISRMISCNMKKEKVLKEIEKCIVLCSNCHKILHYEEKNTPL